MSEPNPFGIDDTPEIRRDREAALVTLQMLADQVGIKCYECRNIIRGHQNIGAVAYMAPLGTTDFKMEAYCERCAEFMASDA